MKTPEQVADDVVGQLSFSTNRMLNGRLVGEQYFAHHAVLDAVRKERAEVKRLREVLFAIQCAQLDQGTNKRLSAKGHRKRAMATRDKIIATLNTD